MSELQRRDFLRSVAIAGCALDAAATERAASTESVPEAGPETAENVTRQLAHYVVSSRAEDLPANVRKEACRTLLNWMGCAVGGSRQDAVSKAIAALAPFAGSGQARLIGRSERMDSLHAALINGISSHVLDFDDTHLKTVIHPAGPVVPALLAVAEQRTVSGREFLHALVLGAEVECRIGNAVYPAHYDIGWHITGTTGVFGAAAAAGRLLKLSERQMVWALGIAATQPVGLREMFGSMTKSFHPGRAAQNGLTAALLASRDFTSSEQSIEAARGWANVLSTARKYDAITGGLGASYEILLNTYKPFACGIVIHPTIDGCIQLRKEQNLKPGEIEAVELRVHPLVLELTGKKTPQTGLEGKFSVYFAAALALTEGAAGEREFSDRLVRDAALVALRDRVSAIVDPSVGEEQVRITVRMKDGRRFEKFVEHVVGSLERPMSDADLEAKFEGLADGVLPAAHTRRLMDLCWNIESQRAAGDLAAAAAS